MDKTLTEVTVHDLYEDDIIYVAELGEYGLVKFSEELGFHAVIVMADEQDYLAKALESTGMAMAYTLDDSRTYEKLIEEEV